MKRSRVWTIRWAVTLAHAALAFGCDSPEKEAISLAIERTTATNPFTGQKTDLRSRMAEQDPSKRYEWRATETPLERIFLVSFVQAEGPQKGWGKYWEVDTRNRVVTEVTGNPALELKYGMTRQRSDVPFQVKSLRYRLFEDIRKSGMFGQHELENRGIVLQVAGEIVNNTSKPLVRADLTASLTVQFSDDKVVRERSTYETGMSPEVSENAPWRPGTSRDFSFRTSPIGLIYLDYEPIIAFSEVDLTVADPIDYKWEGVVHKLDLDWARVRGSAVNSPGVVTANPARLRDSPVGSEITRLREGTKVFVLRERGNWYLLHSSGGVGWADADDLSVTSEPGERADIKQMEGVVRKYRSAVDRKALEEIHALFTESSKRANSLTVLRNHYVNSSTTSDPTLQIEVRHVFGNRLAAVRVITYGRDSNRKNHSDYTLMNENGWKIAWGLADAAKVRSSLASGSWKPAVDWAKKLQRVDPFNKAAYLAFAHDALGRGRPGEAEIICREVLTLHDDCTECELLLASALFLKGQESQGEQMLASAQNRTDFNEILSIWLRRDYNQTPQRPVHGLVLRAGPEEQSEAIHTLVEGETLRVGRRTGRYHAVVVVKKEGDVYSTFSPTLRGFEPDGFVAAKDLFPK